MKMTINELCRQGAEMLEDAGRENAGFDARCLLEYLLEINTTQYMLRRSDKADTKLFNEYMRLIRRRATGEPLQYILGKWEFMDGEFYVGEGVLIPRPETELLVDFAVDFLKNRENPIVIDLCSGSGCIAISVAKAIKKAEVYAVEKYDDAFSYLQKNILHNRVNNVTAVKGDIFDNSLLNDIKPDLILSNPPYIRSEDLPFLQQEVRREPATALDGGRDGYDFYRVLASDWLQRLPKGGAMAVECAEDQADEISQMFFLSRSSVNTINDLSGFPRVVTAVK
ncbi:MAG: peptide chain release factor N(5)-glutamine methyltransferase [Clostridia bacterium]|nr:peptide chain release factor N(5)-glutamine methyltransferase [Clostridia bacterium]